MIFLLVIWSTQRKREIRSGEMRRLRDAGHSEEDIIKYAQGLENEQ